MGFAIITALLTACQRAGTPLNATAVGNFGRFPPFPFNRCTHARIWTFKKDFQKSLLSDNLVLFFWFKETFLTPSADKSIGFLGFKIHFLWAQTIFCTKMEIRPAWAWFSSLKVPWFIYETLCQMIIGQRGGFLCPISVVVKILLEPAVISTALLQKRIFFIEL